MLKIYTMVFSNPHLAYKLYAIQKLLDQAQQLQRLAEQQLNSNHKTVISLLDIKNNRNQKSVWHRIFRDK